MKAIKNPIQFLSKNYLNENCQFDISPGDTLHRDKLYDFDPFKADNLISSDTNQILFTVWFKDNFSQFIVREIDCIILQNINWKSFTISLVQSDNTQIQIADYTDNEETNLFIKLEIPVRAGVISFDVTDTIDSVNEILAGQIRVCKFIMNLSATTESEVNPITDEGSLRTFDGSLVSWTNFEKWGAKVNIQNIKKEQYDLLKSFIKNDGYITIIPWYEWEPKDIYECLITRGKIGTYAVDRWSGLISQTLQLEAKEDAYN